MARAPRGTRTRRQAGGSAAGGRKAGKRQTRTTRSTTGSSKKLGRGRRMSTGIDIGTYAIKIVTIEGDDAGNVAIRKVTKVPLGKPEGAEYEADRLNRQGEALKEASRAHGKMQGRVVLSLPRSCATVRYLNMPSADPEELQDMILFDAERHVPFSIEDMEVGFQILEQLGEHESHVMMVGVPNREFEPYLKLCEDAGIEVEAVDLDVMGDCEAYGRSFDPEEAVAIVNFGRSSINFSVVKENKMLYSRSIPLTEQRLLEGFRGAKTWKDLQGRITAAGALHPTEREHFAHWTEKLSMELMRTMSSFMCESPGIKVNRMILCGAAGYFPAGPPKGMNLRLKTSVSIEKALNGELPSSDDYHGTEMVTSIGVALRGLKYEKGSLNLIPEELVRDRVQSHRSAYRKNIFFLFILIALVAGSGGFLKWYEKYIEFSSADELFSDLQSDTIKLSGMRKKINIVDNYIDKQQSAINVIQRVLESLPPQTYISSISFNKRKTFEIIGQVSSNDDVNKINDMLINLRPAPDKEPFFDHVVRQNTATKEIDLGAKTMQVYEFRIHCTLHWSETDKRAR